MYNPQSIGKLESGSLNVETLEAESEILQVHLLVAVRIAMLTENMTFTASHDASQREVLTISHDLERICIGYANEVATPSASPDPLLHAWLETRIPKIAPAVPVSWTTAEAPWKWLAATEVSSQLLCFSPVSRPSSACLLLIETGCPSKLAEALNEKLKHCIQAWIAVHGEGFDGGFGQAEFYQGDMLGLD